jgi:hypothetical protein
LFCFLPLQRTFGPEKGVLKLNKEMKYVAEVFSGEGRYDSLEVGGGEW